MIYLISFFFFFFNDTATTEIYTLSPTRRSSDLKRILMEDVMLSEAMATQEVERYTFRSPAQATSYFRSEEHTSELQSQFHLVCRLLLEKKKKKKNKNHVIE